MDALSIALCEKKKIFRNEKRHFLINRTETEINRTFVMNKISKS